MQIDLLRREAATNFYTTELTKCNSDDAVGVINLFKFCRETEELYRRFNEDNMLTKNIYMYSPTPVETFEGFLYDPFFLIIT